MMKINLIAFFILAQVGYPAFSQVVEQRIVTDDIDNFWIAHDQIMVTNDSLERIKLINQLYIDKGTEGLKNLIEVRRYKDYELANNIIKYPKYWQSIRANIANVHRFTNQIEVNIKKLKKIYPELKPATIYFSFGAFRTGGTYHDNMILLGSEYLFANPNSELQELPQRIQNVIKEYSPYDIPLLVTHEYIHTQQKRWEDNSMIQRCVAEGVAEFVSTLITERPLSPPVKFGKQNSKEVLKQFMYEIFRDDDVDNWLWNTNQNHLKVNDLGYYIGYEICERYYNKSSDKKAAIKELIELDYGNTKAFAKVVDATDFFPMSINEMGKKYESLRPTVVRILELENGKTDVSPELKALTIEFSAPISNCCRSFDIVETEGVERIVIKKHVGWSDDKKQYSFEIEALKPNTTYGLIISNFAREDGGNRLAPYTIQFKTKK